jgi:hypothetical protein
VQLYQDLEHMLIADEAEEDFAIHWRLGDWVPGDTVLVCSDGLHDTLGSSRWGRSIVRSVHWRSRPLSISMRSWMRVRPTMCL